MATAVYKGTSGDVGFRALDPNNSLSGIRTITLIQHSTAIQISHLNDQNVVFFVDYIWFLFACHFLPDFVCWFGLLINSWYYIHSSARTSWHLHNVWIFSPLCSGPTGLFPSKWMESSCVLVSSVSINCKVSYLLIMTSFGYLITTTSSHLSYFLSTWSGFKDTKV